MTQIIKIDQKTVEIDGKKYVLEEPDKMSGWSYLDEKSEWKEPTEDIFKNYRKDLEGLGSYNFGNSYKYYKSKTRTGGFTVLWRKKN